MSKQDCKIVSFAASVFNTFCPNQRLNEQTDEYCLVLERYAKKKKTTRDIVSISFLSYSASHSTMFMWDLKAIKRGITKTIHGKGLILSPQVHF